MAFLSIRIVLSAVIAVQSLTAAIVYAGELRLGAPFSNHMVVQEGRPLPVWGWDQPGTSVEVSLDGHSAKATADTDGRWEVELATPANEGPHMIVVVGSERMEIEDVLVGDVWWCSGQSNMAFEVSRSEEGAAAMRAAENGRIRLLQMPRISADEPRDDAEVTWQVAGPKTIGSFSAVAYYFGEKVSEETGRPIGLVNASWGGSPIRAWLPEKAIKASPFARDVVAEAEREAASYETRMAAWEAGGKKGKRPSLNGGGPQHRLYKLYNGMMHPIERLPVRGVLWYQGEADTGRPEVYSDLFPRLVATWRRHFADGGMLPVYFVQLPNFENNQREKWAKFREAQRRLAATPDDGIEMVVAIDVGDPGDIHPTNKRVIGDRLARLALRETYGREDLPQEPRPTAASWKADEQAVDIAFDEGVGDGLRLRDGKSPIGFELVGSDGKATAVDAELAGPSTVRLAWQDERPWSVRYAYAADPDTNLESSAGDPVTPFELAIVE